MGSLTDSGSALTQLVECVMRVSGKAVYVTARALKFIKLASFSTDCFEEVFERVLGRFIIRMVLVLKASGMVKGLMASVCK